MLTVHHPKFHEIRHEITEDRLDEFVANGWVLEQPKPAKKATRKTPARKKTAR